MCGKSLVESPFRLDLWSSLFNLWEPQTARCTRQSARNVSSKLLAQLIVTCCPISHLLIKKNSILSEFRAVLSPRDAYMVEWGHLIDRCFQSWFHQTKKKRLASSIPIYQTASSLPAVPPCPNSPLWSEPPHYPFCHFPIHSRLLRTSRYLVLSMFD